MFDTNPTLIQPPTLPFPPNTSQRTPLFLIHDGGGTTFDYFFLGNLQRSTYGIHNPNFSTGVPWEGGLPQLASLYIAFIRSLLFSSSSTSTSTSTSTSNASSTPSASQPTTEIILGGWSLGGLLSLEISHQLSLRAATDNPPLKVKGIIMIDSIYPGNRDTGKMRKILPSMPVFRETCTAETRRNVQRCLDLAVEMVGRWEMPRWGVKGASNSSSEGGGEGGRCTEAMPPPTILLKAIEPLPLPPGTVVGPGEDVVSSFDVHRGSKTLGWENYGKKEGGAYDLIKAATDVPGHHFNLFQEQENASVVTEKVRWACEVIDRG